MNTKKEKHITSFIRSICKNNTKEDQKQAELNFLRFIKLVEKISNRIANKKGK